MPFIVIAAIAGGLAGALSALLIRDPGKKGLRLVVAVVLFVALGGLGRVTVLPRLYEWQADHELQKLDVYRQIAKRDPATYGQVKDYMVHAMLRGDSANTAVKQVAGILLAAFPRYAASASDESVIRFVQVTNDGTQQLQRVGPDACYGFLFPKAISGDDLPSSHLDPKVQEGLLAALADVVRTSAESPQVPPDPAQSQVLLKGIQQNLVKQYDGDLKLVGAQQSDPASRAKVCAITINLYRQILALPPQDAGLLLRYLLSQKG